MDDRIHRLEQSLADENTRHRQRMLRTAGGPPIFSGALHESAADFCTDLQRFMHNSGIRDQDLVNYVPDYLTGSAREFFRTLTPDNTATLAAFRQTLVGHFDSDSRRQASLQKFYQADQHDRETVADYYCRMKEISRAAFSNLDDQARAQQVLARMRQGLRPDIRRALIGTAAPASPEALKLTAEAVEMEIRQVPTTTPATTADIRALVAELKTTTQSDFIFYNNIPS